MGAAAWALEGHRVGGPFLPPGQWQSRGGRRGVEGGVAPCKVVWPQCTGSVSSERETGASLSWTFHGGWEGMVGSRGVPPEGRIGAGGGGSNGYTSRKELRSTRCVFNTKETHVSVSRTTCSARGSASQPGPGCCHRQTHQGPGDTTGQATPHRRWHRSICRRRGLQARPSQSTETGPEPENEHLGNVKPGDGAVV